MLQFYGARILCRISSLVLFRILNGILLVCRLGPRDCISASSILLMYNRVHTTRTVYASFSRLFSSRCWTTDAGHWNELDECLVELNLTPRRFIIRTYIIFVNSKILKRYSAAKGQVPTYSRPLLVPSYQRGTVLQQRHILHSFKSHVISVLYT